MPSGLPLFGNQHYPGSRRIRRENALQRTCRPSAGKIVAFILLLCLVMYIVFFLDLPPVVEIDESYSAAVDEKIVKKRIGFDVSYVDNTCSPTTKQCYSILDKRKLSTKRLSDGSVPEYIERHLVFKGFEETSDTIVYLKPPQGEQFHTSDSRLWSVDHSRIGPQYVAGMLALPFTVNALSLKGIAEDVLIIGLGGGNLDMSLHHYMPMLRISVVELDETIVNLAQKWFEVQNTTNHRTIVDDGVRFLQSRTDEKYAVIVIDACDSHALVPCPAQVFQQQSVIERTRKLLKPTGCLVVNILAENKEGVLQEPELNEVISKYAAVYSTCFTLRMTRELNVLLVCLPYKLAHPQEELQLYEKGLRDVTNFFNLQDHLSDVKFVA